MFQENVTPIASTQTYHRVSTTTQPSYSYESTLTMISSVNDLKYAIFRPISAPARELFRYNYYFRAGYEGSLCVNPKDTDS